MRDLWTVLSNTEEHSPLMGEQSEEIDPQNQIFKDKYEFFRSKNEKISVLTYRDCVCACVWLGMWLCELHVFMHTCVWMCVHACSYMSLGEKMVQQ